MIKYPLSGHSLQSKSISQLIITAAISKKIFDESKRKWASVQRWMLSSVFMELKWSGFEAMRGYGNDEIDA